MPAIIATGQHYTPAVIGQGKAALVVGTQEWVSRITNCEVNAMGCDWGLKMSGNQDSVFTDCKFIGGMERALDIVQGGNLVFNRCGFSAGTERPMTTSRLSLQKTCDIGIKAGFEGAEFNRCELADILLGDHSIYDNPHIGRKTRGIALTDCVHPLGAHIPIVIRCLNAETPTLTRTNAVMMRYWRGVVLTYFFIAGRWIDSRVGIPTPQTK